MSDESEPQPLSDRQLEIVIHLANGLRMDEIAEEMSFSVSSLKSTLRRAKKRKGARTNAHLVSICIAQNELAWHPELQMRFGDREPGDESPDPQAAKTPAAS
jgi:DNA-binding CsgD family transcriptional regulator